MNDLSGGFPALRRLVQDVVKKSSYSGHLFVFRGKRADQIKILWWDGTGLCLYAKRLERGRFVWPLTQEGAAVLTPAQLSMLCEGLIGGRRCAPMRRAMCRYAPADRVIGRVICQSDIMHRGPNGANQLLWGA